MKTLDKRAAILNLLNIKAAKEQAQNAPDKQSAIAALMPIIERREREYRKELTRAER